MPTIKEKLNYEQHNECTIRLWPEGGFYKAYERSAHLFVTCVRPYAVRRKYYKVVGRDVVETGFPQSVLARLGMDVVEHQGAMLLKVDSCIDEQSYRIWHESVPLQVTATAPRPERAVAAVQQPMAQLEHQVAERIRQLNMADMTPMQCMVLLSELSRLLT